MLYKHRNLNNNLNRRIFKSFKEIHRKTHSAGLNFEKRENQSIVICIHSIIE